MKKVMLIAVVLVIIIFSAVVVIFFNPDRLTPENPEGKTMYYTVVENANIKIDHSKRKWPEGGNALNQLDVQ